MQLKCCVVLTIFQFSCIPLMFSQWGGNSEGGIQLSSENAFPSYTLIENSTQTYLINTCGEIVHEWPQVGDTDLHPKLLPNGNLLYIRNNRVTERNWDGELVNQVTHGDDDLELKYEVILKENNNYLCVGRRDFSFDAFTNIGFEFTYNFPSVVDVVVELDRETGEIVWEWNISDHVIQQRDPELPNYGILSENPQLVNLDGLGYYDWTNYESFMINGMDYNPELQQVALSVRKMNEIMIIDQSTTTEEAKGSNGGRYNKGGDILYRWGNPQNYGYGTEEDRKLYYQHNPNWIKYGKHTGKMICFNNGLNRPNVGYNERYSSAPILALPMDFNGNFIRESGSAFGPEEAEIDYSRPTTNTDFYSAYTSGATVLPNGNIYITEGVDGVIFELDQEGNKIWIYDTPNVSYLFRSEKYGLDYPAFEGKKLIPNGYIEDPISDYECTVLSSNKNKVKDPVIFKHNMEIGKLDIVNPSGRFDYQIFDIHGKQILSNRSSVNYVSISTQTFISGMYIVSVTDYENRISSNYKIIVP